MSAPGVAAVARPLGREDALALMRRTPVILESLVAGFPADLLERRPAPDEWSAREILRHLVGVEELLFARVASMVASGGAPAGGHPAPSGARVETAALLARWRAARERTQQRVASLSADELGRGADLRRWGYLRVEEQVCEWAYHDLEHVRQLLATEEAFLYPAIGGFRGLYAPPFPDRAVAGEG